MKALGLAVWEVSSAISTKPLYIVNKWRGRVARFWRICTTLHLSPGIKHLCTSRHSSTIPTDSPIYEDDKLIYEGEASGYSLQEYPEDINS